MRRWPPIVWPLMSVASLLILIGATGGGRPPFLIVGGALAVAVLALSLYSATRADSARPRTKGAQWALAGLALFYLILAAAAGAAGTSYMLAGLAAGVIPLSALALLVATVRSKTVAERDGLRDASAADSEDPYPGVGLDEGTALGESPEHSDAVEDRK
jgi:hypothetical protein